jgi:type VI protein secretion system component VasK
VSGSGESQQPFDPRLDRYRPLTWALQRALVLCAVLAVLAVVVPAPAGGWFGIGVVVLLVGVPLARVVWFVQRWFRRGDVRYALVGCGVLVVIAVGLLLALLGV